MKGHVGGLSNANKNLNNASYAEFKALTDNSRREYVHYSNTTLCRLYVFRAEKEKNNVVGALKVFLNLQMSIPILKSAKVFQSSFFF